MPRRQAPWLSKEERRRMELLRSDLRVQAARTGDDEVRAELEAGIRTLSRELAFDLRERS